MEHPIQSVTLASGSLIVQLCLLAVAFAALRLLTKSRSAIQVAKESNGTLVSWALLTFAIIFIGEDYYRLWGPILGEIELPTIPRNYAFLAVFVLDIVFITILILRTGGAKNSPFTSMLFLLPTLAIFLREPAVRFISYAVAVGLIYTFILRKRLYVQAPDFDWDEYDGPSKEDRRVEDHATIFANVMCLLVATLIGYITRPH